MPIKTANPPAVHTPGAYAHAVLVTDPKRRLVISGQVGTAPDGSTAEAGDDQQRAGRPALPGRGRGRGGGMIQRG